MNINKAREYFSAYYEGQLDKGLAQSFERALRDDAQLQAEYRAFKGTMEELSILSSSSVELPDDLHDKITARLDRHIWENKQTQRTGVAQWWRMFAIGGAAVAMIAIVMIQANRSGPQAVNPPVSQSGIPLVPHSEKSRLEILPTEKGVSISYSATEGKSIVISDAEGKELETVPVSQNLEMKDKPLANAGEHAALLSIKVGDQEPVWVALPGSKKAEFTAGSGTLKQFIESVADGFQTPVVLNGDGITANVVWDRGDDLIATANKFAESQKLKAEVRQGAGDRSLLWIQKH